MDSEEINSVAICDGSYQYIDWTRKDMTFCHSAAMTFLFLDLLFLCALSASCEHFRVLLSFCLYFVFEAHKKKPCCGNV